MDYYGVSMEGPFHGERVDTLPVWTASDEGREIYCLDTDLRYYGTSTGWVKYADADGVVLKADFNANTILAANANDTRTSKIFFIKFLQFFYKVDATYLIIKRYNEI